MLKLTELKTNFIYIITIDWRINMNIKFEQKGTIFNYRIVAIIIKDNKVLFQKLEKDKFWAPIGGRCQLNETSIEAIKREIYEEIEVTEIKDLNLIWVVENFFNINNNNIHEISFYYNVTLGDNEEIYKLKEFKGKEKEKNIYFKWFNLKNIEQEPIKPDFLKKSLTNISNNISHYIEVE